MVRSSIAPGWLVTWPASWSSELGVIGPDDLLNNGGDLGSQRLKSGRSKLPGHRKPFGTLESLDSLAGAGAEHAVSVQVSIAEINERFLDGPDLLLGERSRWCRT
jgi:hypothetical protein